MTQIEENIQASEERQPLTRFTCDSCFQLIGCTEQGVFEFMAVIDGDGHYVAGPRIVHHAVYSPRQNGGGNCYGYDSLPQGKLQMTCDLSDVAGANAVAYLLNLIAPVEPFHPNPSLPPVRREDVKDWAEMIRRLTVPFYEEVRPFMGTARADGFVEGLSEATIHSKATLAAMIDRYGIGPRLPLNGWP